MDSSSATAGAAVDLAVGACVTGGRGIGAEGDVEAECACAADAAAELAVRA